MCDDRVNERTRLLAAAKVSPQSVTLGGDERRDVVIKRGSCEPDARAGEADNREEPECRRQVIEVSPGFVRKVLPDDHRRVEISGALLQRLLDYA